MHQIATILISIAAIWFAATLVPGPDFLATTRVALTNNRATNLRTVLGIACGTCVWGLAGFFGIHNPLRRWIDRLAGLAFIGFGTSLALER
jgi:threonine/homoserine/homoserine lactone efflux protein